MPTRLSNAGGRAKKAEKSTVLPAFCHIKAVVENFDLRPEPETVVICLDLRLARVQFRCHSHMELFYQTFGIIAAFCAGIIILTLFFTGIGYFKRSTRGFEVVKLKGFIKDGKLINVYLNGGRSVLGVRFVGFTDGVAGKGGVPYQLSSMVVLETAKGARVLVRADAVRMIEEIEGAA